MNALFIILQTYLSFYLPLVLVVLLMMLYRAINYTRVFTEMGESLVEAIVKTPNEVC